MDRNQEGTACPKCEKQNIKSFLKFMYISLEEMVLKCESPTCLFPFKGFKYKNALNGTITTVEFKRDNPLKLKQEDTSKFELEESPQFLESVVVKCLEDFESQNLETSYEDKISSAENVLGYQISMDLPTLPLKSTANEDSINNLKSREKLNNDEQIITFDFSEIFKGISDIDFQTDQKNEDIKPLAVEVHPKIVDNSPTQSTTATISRYLDMIAAKHKKTKSSKKKLVGKITKDSKKLAMSCDTKTIKTPMPKLDKTLNRPLDILRTIQKL